MTLKVKVNDNYFELQILWFQLNSVMSYHAD